MTAPELTRHQTCTALPGFSIWDNTPESTFRQHVVDLEKQTNAVPLDSQVFSASNWGNDHVAPTIHQLSLSQEQELADDVSFIAAVGEGAQSVAAATVQLARSPAKDPTIPSLRYTIASVDAIDPSSQQFLRSLYNELSSASASSKDIVVDKVFDQLASYHSQRLLNRLRSARWVKPTYLARTHKRPLFADFGNLTHRAQLLYSRSERSQRTDLETQLSSLASVLEAFELNPEGGPGAEDEQRRALIRACFDFCVSPAVGDFLRRLQNVRATSQIQACLKTMQQVEKIAAYYRIPQTLVNYAVEFPGLFERVEFVFLTPYEAKPIDLAYQSWATSTHVHAEVILSVHHDLSKDSNESLTQPRCMGASKYLCYLCYLFICHHGTYFPSSTHGACYDQWTIPDLAVYSDDMKRRYQAIVDGMDRDVVGALSSAIRRPEPMTSRENLIDAYRGT